MNQPPTFTVIPEAVEVTKGQTVYFLSKASGKPTPQISWYKDDRLLMEDDQISVETTERELETTSACTIKDILLDQEGLYTVEASNAAGSVTNDLMLSGILFVYLLPIFFLCF